MWRYLVGTLIGITIASVSVEAYRMAKPPTFDKWDSNTFSQLNDVLLQMWNITNGRYAIDVVTSDPDGSRKGSKGEMVLYDTGTDQLCVNTNGGTTWHCVNIT